MKNSNLQVILDMGLVGKRDIAEVASELVDGGADCIQFRDKVSCDRVLLEEAKKIRKIAKDCIFIINDRIDIARLCEADGVHLGQDDLPYEEARRLVGKNRLIGISTHNINQAKEAEELGVDYIGVGPIFPTTTKPDLKAIGLEIVEAVSKDIEIPAFFIGGIDLINIGEILKKGGKRVAVASAILNSDDIAGATRLMVGTLSFHKVEIQR